MAQIVCSKSQEPREESQQSDVRGQLGCRIPTGPRQNRYLQVAARSGRLEAVRQAQLDGHSICICQRVRGRGHEDTGPRASGLNLGDFEVITRVGDRARCTPEIKSSRSTYETAQPRAGDSTPE